MLPQQRLAFYHSIVARGNSQLWEANDDNKDGKGFSNERWDFLSEFIYHLYVHTESVCCSLHTLGGCVRPQTESGSEQSSPACVLVMVVPPEEKENVQR